MVKSLARDCDKPCYNGRSVVLIFQVKRNGEQFENGDQEFNEKIFEMWKIKIEDMLVDTNQ